MGKTKAEKKKAKALAAAKKDLFQSYGLTPPALRPPGEEHALRPLNEENALRSPEGETSRLSTSSEEGVLDTSLSAQGKEQAPVSTVASSAKVEEDKRVMSVTVMTKDKEATTVLTVGGKEPYSLPVQRLIGQAMRFMRPDKPPGQKAVDSAKPAREQKAEDANVEVDY